MLSVVTCTSHSWVLKSVLLLVSTLLRSIVGSILLVLHLLVPAIVPSVVLSVSKAAATDDNEGAADTYKAA